MTPRPPNGLLQIGGPAAPGRSTVKDPVCHMDVDPATARWKHEHGGKAYYFCAEHCLKKFAADPAAYL